MNYHTYYPIDVLNGPGTRAVIFVSGCEHQCKGCYNQSTLRLDSGHLFDQEMEDQIIADLQDQRIKRRGLTLSGGDPLHPENISAILQLVKRVERECPDKDIWCWTGYKLSELNERQQQVLPYLSALVDGKFVKELADPSLKWRGSSNQVIHQFDK
ncbi:anaerobic ribonucleoside-triphosphate reductase-activating protein [Vibrio sp. SS-MA-C1-2]|uniref:anaerobic ribonucleoside-triphosphate reductase-activating protein n=1 Tax=Vibrio sp. SS-MA-C1-2 TaxID=2908646 RepID=UPI001F37D808|nr:anaerobic ribonucleoside-triphosphate reductase-activating protein [Vibrio sp. SS-MA-C1-2]UJF16940.1 anaerobic ribonucleoside-triphosphate reductase-activating protein [Vibrio sp. SS-MA-C1-2]